jgi:hypothetical protein
MQIELLGPELQRIAGCARDEHSADRLPQVRGLPLEDRLGAAGDTLAPELVDQTRGRDDVPGLQRENGQDGALLRPAERERAPVDLHVERAQNPNVERHRSD